jgi:hypothetical protein
VLCYKLINYAKYIKNVCREKCVFKLLTIHQFKLVKEQKFQLSSGCNSVEISFEERLLDGQLPSELIFSHSV